jgi:hypothetical protein
MTKNAECSSNGDLADDLLKGAKEIAAFSGFSERQVFYLVSTGALRSVFKVGPRKLCARRSSLLREVQALETGKNG